RRTWWGQRRRWPCPVWIAAHTNLVVCHPAVAESQAPVETAAVTQPLPPVRETVTVTAPAGLFHPTARRLARRPEVT
ncbi:MAG: hypothetical protein ACRDRZ_00460, partial [Pseudonocardiaceae bacterium]